MMYLEIHKSEGKLNISSAVDHCEYHLYLHEICSAMLWIRPTHFFKVPV